MCPLTSRCDSVAAGAPLGSPPLGNEDDAAALPDILLGESATTSAVGLTTAAELAT